MSKKQKQPELEVEPIDDEAVRGEPLVVAVEEVVAPLVVKPRPNGDLLMRNLRGTIRAIPARMVSTCRRKGFLAVDEAGNVLENDKQPPLVSEFAESQLQPRAVKGGAPKVRDLD